MASASSTTKLSGGAPWRSLSNDVIVFVSNLQLALPERCPSASILQEIGRSSRANKFLFCYKHSPKQRIYLHQEVNWIETQLSVQHQTPYQSYLPYPSVLMTSLKRNSNQFSLWQVKNLEMTLEDLSLTWQFWSSCSWSQFKSLWLVFSKFYSLFDKIVSLNLVNNIFAIINFTLFIAWKKKKNMLKVTKFIHDLMYRFHITRLESLQNQIKGRTYSTPIANCLSTAADGMISISKLSELNKLPSDSWKL